MHAFFRRKNRGGISVFAKSRALRRTIVKRQTTVFSVAFVFHFMSAIPYRKKHTFEYARRVAVNRDSRVFPISERTFNICVFVRDIETARKRGFTVYCGDFSVVAVIQARINKRNESVKNFNFRAESFKLFLILSARL